MFPPGHEASFAITSPFSRPLLSDGTVSNLPPGLSLHPQYRCPRARSAVRPAGRGVRGGVARCRKAEGLRRRGIRGAARPSLRGAWRAFFCRCCCFVAVFQARASHEFFICFCSKRVPSREVGTTVFLLGRGGACWEGAFLSHMKRKSRHRHVMCRLSLSVNQRSLWRHYCTTRASM